MTKEQKKNENLSFGIALIIFTVITMYLMYRKHEASKELDSCHRYTIGEVYNHLYMYRSGEQINCKFTYNSKEYILTKTGSDLKQTKGKNYLVKFNPDNPKISEILLDKVIPKHIVAPSEGWKTKPRIDE
ncbi:hypothetical protein [Saccharicrinis aurantiacus]|uniref:hypothetical protein n=1 Tax=Saccharicrinis aurantiacus TaxID=1849719 RepID=UPI002490FDC9|nr:hypothetical protein [Saccharicrinis aurantiacus]